MRIMIVLPVLLLLTMCVRTAETTQQDSQIADITIPALQDQHLAVYGKNCEAVKIPQDVLNKLNGKTGCEAVKALLGHFRLEIAQAKGTTCESGVVATSIKDAGAQIGQSISQKVRRGCDYSVLLQLGFAQKNPSNPNAMVITPYLSNEASAEGNLTREMLKQENPVVTVKLQRTEEGKKVGFPEGAIEILGTTDVEIQVEILPPKQDDK